ncbi:MAG: hypothetical protein CM1200mP36_09900 [Gammaproteobacteria bacterium]|nr:MAG: hypothetical protein CM1200mP36_09900 [Gammaproteobacteria bacterium]
MKKPRKPLAGPESREATFCAFLELPDSVKELLVQRTLNMGHARALLALNRLRTS